MGIVGVRFGVLRVTRVRGLVVTAGLSVVLFLGASGCGGPVAASPTSAATTTITPGAPTSGPSVSGGDETGGGTSKSAVPDPLSSAQAIMDAWTAAGSGGVVLSYNPGGGPLTTLASGAAGPDGAPLTASAQFRVGSISKTFAAVMMLQLVDEGALTLDQQVADIDPALDIAAGVTIRQLLNHSSGIPNYLTDAVIAELDADPSRVWTPAEVLAQVANEPRVFEPGSRHEYSNTNYVLVGLLIEKLTGAALAANLKTRITGPLGLADTYYAPDPTRRPIDGFSKDHGAATSTFDYTSTETIAGAAGALVSTAGDLSRFLTALTDGTLLPETALAQMRPPAGDFWGLGIFAGSLLTGPALGHDGSIPGFQAVMAVNPLTGETLVVLTNDDHRELNSLVQHVLLAG